MDGVDGGLHTRMFKVMSINVRGNHDKDEKIKHETPWKECGAPRSLS